MKDFAAMRSKGYNYLTATTIKKKEQKAQKKEKCAMKRKIKFEDFKSCLEPTQIENKIKKLEKNQFDVNSLRENHKEFIENNN